MDMQKRRNDPKFWRDHAEEAQAIADGMRNPSTKATMEQVARGYDNLAEQAAKRAEKPESRKRRTTD
jgi:hypothetical protein